MNNTTNLIFIDYKWTGFYPFLQYLSPRKALQLNLTASYDELFHVDFNGSSTDYGNGLNYNMHPVEQLRHSSDVTDIATTHNRMMMQHYDTPPNSRHAVATVSSSTRAAVDELLTPATKTCSSLYSNSAISGDVAYVTSNESRRLLLSSTSTTSAD